MQLKIYATADVPRLRYIAGVILWDILGLSWEIVTDKRKLGKYPVLNYSTENLKGSFKVNPSPLLFETGVHPVDVEVKEWNGLPVFFESGTQDDLPFDIFAASFFLISRYEEYLKREPEESGRFRARSSVAFRNGFLRRPVIDLWAREFARALLRKFRSLTFKRNEFRALTTFNIDQPFAYLGQGLISSIGGMLRDLTKADGHAAERYRTIVKGEKDPFEVFDYISGTIDKYSAGCRFFFPVGDRTMNKKNPSWKNENYRKLISLMAEKYTCGLYPSYSSSENYTRICTERNRLQEITGSEISASRFRLIRILMPDSLQCVHEAGIVEDYSMGFPEEPGFRSGISRPYNFFNLLTDVQTELKICPFQFMDTHLDKNIIRNPAEGMELILTLINEVRNVGGTFVSIWHNTSLLDKEEWKEYREAFEYTIRSQTGDNQP